MRLPRSAARESKYREAIKGVLGPPGLSTKSGLALAWAHEIAWKECGSPDLDELQLLNRLATDYGVPLDEVMDERGKREAAAQAAVAAKRIIGKPVQPVAAPAIAVLPAPDPEQAKIPVRGRPTFPRRDTGR